jgi:peptidoglycan/LPS O-acetylase OafA/YrhL
MTYRPDIDGLRALAILSVLAFHFQIGRYSNVGFIGVDVFFVISGYLICSGVVGQMERGTFSLRSFFEHRVRRLAPAFILVQIVTLIVAAALFLPLELAALARETVFSQLFVSNIYYWQNLNYFALTAQHAYMLHTWSLSVEAQFYMLLPVTLLLARRVAPRHMSGVLLLSGLVSIALNFLFVASKPEATFFLLATRWWEFVAGAMAIRIQPAFVDRAWLRTAGAASAIVLIVCTILLYEPSMGIPGWFTLMPVAATCLAIVSGAGDGNSLLRILHLRGVVWVGKLSYPLYLVHWPIAVFVANILPTFGDFGRVWLIGSTIEFGIAVYIAETIIRRRTLPWSGRKVIATYMACAAVIIVVCASAWASAGWRWRFSPHALTAADVAGRGTGIADYAYVDGSLPAKLHRVGAPGAPPHWLILGDSHAAALALAFSSWLQQRGEAGYIAYSPGCVPVATNIEPRCQRLMRAALSYLKQDRQIGSVMLVSIWRNVLGDQRRASPRDGGVDANIVPDIHRTVTEMKTMGLRLYVWEPIPSMPTSVPETIARARIFGGPADMTASLRAYRADTAALRAALDREGGLIDGRIDPSLAMCDADRCFGSLRGEPLLRDSNHPAPGQSAYFAAMMTAQLASAPKAIAR